MSYELVRVSKEMLDDLLDADSEPVVLLRIERKDDGTCVLILRRVDAAAADAGAA